MPIVPSTDAPSIQLPKQSAAQYMLNAEIPTLKSAHKALVLNKSAEMHLDHTRPTKAIDMNNICFSVGEVPDGTAESVLEHINHERTLA